MMSPRPVLLWCLYVWGTTLAFVLLPGSARADSGVLPKDGSEKLKDSYAKAHDSFRDLLTGTRDPKDNKEAIDTLAQWYTYRLTWPEFQTKDGFVYNLMKELDADLTVAMRNRPASGPFLELFCKQLTANAKEVLDPQQPPITGLNAARVLWYVAHTGDESPAEVLADVLKDPKQSDGVKYWACRALQQLFAPAGLEDYARMPPRLLKDKDAQARCTLALIDFVQRAVPVSAATPVAELEGLRSARREALHALALTQNPAVADAKGSKGRTALTLVRVIGFDGFVPEPRWDEEVEAAVGIGWLNPGLFPDYEPDYAAWFAGKAAVDFARIYEAEKLQGGKRVDKGWKYNAARMAEAMDAMQRNVAKNVKNKATVQYVESVAIQTITTLKLIETAGDTKPGDLDGWLHNHLPQSATVYRNDPDAKVRAPETTEK
jgi:hypothetical protein